MATPKLMKTSDYSLFELAKINRDVRKLKDLRASMAQHGFLPAYPLHVSKNGTAILKVKAGHHRLTVAKELGLPVYYVISNDDATIHELEAATVPWSLKDHLESFARCGEEPYVILKEYHERTGLPLSVCISLLAGDQGSCGGNHVPKFKSGRYQIKDRAFAEKVADIVMHCEQLGVRAANQRFAGGVSRCLRVAEFCPRQFKAKASAHTFLLEPQRSSQEQMTLMEQVYNYKSSAKIPLVFLADQAMAKRNRALANMAPKHGTDEN